MTSPITISLSVVMPAYNEEGSIADAVAELQQWVMGIIPNAELIVIDDGSRDRTGQILDGLAAKESRLHVVHKPNAGHGTALRTGLDLARGEYVFLLDSDRQIPLDAFPKLWQAAQGRDGAFGSRWPRRDPVFRLILTRFVRLLLCLFLGVRLCDANCPFKIVRRSSWLQARDLMPKDTVTPSLFLAVYMVRRKLDVVQLPVPHRVRSTGVVSIRRWKLIKTCAKAFRQLLEFWTNI